MSLEYEKYVMKMVAGLPFTLNIAIAYIIQLLFTRYLDPLQVHRVHDGALEEGDGGEVSLDQPLQLQAWRGPGHRESAQLASGVMCQVYFNVLFVLALKHLQMLLCVQYIFILRK